jgi:hypothetical protein
MTKDCNHGEESACGICAGVDERGRLIDFKTREVWAEGPIYTRPEDWRWFEHYKDRTFFWLKVGPLVVQAFRMESTGWEWDATWI